MPAQSVIRELSLAIEELNQFFSGKVKRNDSTVRRICTEVRAQTQSNTYKIITQDFTIDKFSAEFGQTSFTPSINCNWENGIL